MKRVCPFCKNNKLIKWGNRRRKCNKCDKTFSVNKQGRKKNRLTAMYILDRSTYRRISKKEKISHVEIIRKLMQELSSINSLIFYTKNFNKS